MVPEPGSGIRSGWGITLAGEVVSSRPSRIPLAMPGSSHPDLLHMTYGPLTIAYSSDVLEPRPWTQAQSRWAAELLDAAPAGPILELCSGAGHIGILAVVLSGGRRPLTTVDANPEAVRLGTLNAVRAGLTVDARLGALDSTLNDEERFALVIADPPWVPSAMTGRFPEDPVLAIDGGADGLELARLCVSLAARHLLPAGRLLLQLGDIGQADLLAPLASAQGLVDRERRTYERGVVVCYSRDADDRSEPGDRGRRESVSHR